MIVEKKQSNLEVAVMVLTGACNMECAFCVTENQVTTMSWHLALNLLKELKSKGATSIVFGGGEPFLWKENLFLLCQEAKQLGLKVQIGTNATRLPAGFETLHYIDRFVLPLDSMDVTIHNSLRLYKDQNHQKTIFEALKILKGTSKEVTISTVVVQQNYQHLNEIAKFLSDYHQSGGRVHAWHLYQFLPFGRGGRGNAAILELTKEQYNEACRQIKESGLKFPVYKRPDMYRSKNVGFYWMEEGQLQSFEP